MGESLRHSCIEPYSEVFEHELQRDTGVSSWEEGHPLRESELLALEGKHNVPFQFLAYEPSYENRVLTEIVMNTMSLILARQFLLRVNSKLKVWQNYKKRESVRTSETHMTSNSIAILESIFLLSLTCCVR